jgi:hypothetical protein
MVQQGATWCSVVIIGGGGLRRYHPPDTALTNYGELKRW